MLSFKQYSGLLEEGGAGGHMDHPFDLPNVKTGDDLIELFNNTVNFLKVEPAVLKIDGINLSVRLITTGVKTEFAIDRGTNKPIDKAGVTIDKLPERFSKKDPDTNTLVPNTDFIAKCEKTLTILNNAIPTIMPLLKQLNLVGTERYINLEYVEKRGNVIIYESEFLVLHNIKEFGYGLTDKTKKPTRIKKDADYNRQALAKLAEALKPFAAEYDFSVYNEIAATLKTAPDFNKVLNEPFAISFSKIDIVTKPLGEWLKNLKNPIETMVTFLDGIKRDAISKEAIYVPVVKGVPLNEFISPKSIEDAKAGAIFYHATRMLGNELLLNIDTMFGSAAKQEGIVINNASVAPKVFKITGEFIISGLQSRFRADKADDKGKTAVFTFGRFNPPTEAHQKLLKSLLVTGKEVHADLIAVFPSHTQNKKTDPLTFEQKAYYLRLIAPEQIQVLPQGKTLFTVLKYLTEQGYTKAIQVAGSDRIPEFEKLVNMYNNKPSKTQHEVLFNIPDYTFKSSGQRDADSDNAIKGMSASKAREYALNDDRRGFRRIIAAKLSDVEMTDLFNIVRNALT